MPYIIIVLLILVAVAVITYRYRMGSVAILVGSIVLGVVSYFMVGVGIARLSGAGRFYSVPFGQDRVRDADIILSLACWILMCAILTYATSRRGDRPG